MKNLLLTQGAKKFLILLIILSAGTPGCTTTSPTNLSETTAPLESGASEVNEATANPPEEPRLSIFHYFNDALGRKAMDEVIGLFHKAHPAIEPLRNPMDHEAYKVVIPALLAGDNQPDVFSYWAGARVQFIVDEGYLQPVDDLWAGNNLDQVFPPGIAGGATYNGQKYFIPIGYHYVAFFYNKQLFDTIGAAPPTTWDDLKNVAAKFKQAGISAFVLGSRERWPAQFWFDYLLLRTAGPAYRAELMAGKKSYTDPEVVRVMELWKELIDAGYFYPDANAYDWAEAAEAVARGQAAMTLMGTWITGYYKNDLGLAPEKDYDYFTFPVIAEGIPRAALGPIDGFVMAKGALHPEAARQFLAFLAMPEPQIIWTQGQGALPPSIKVDPSIYDPLIQRVLKDVVQADAFAFNYDLATPPPMAEAGLNAFSEFMAQPDNYLNTLQKTESSRLEIFKE
ncbi:MAG: extracellular solute-binding protein [Acidobacteria bacterium]|nr:extracellular solute-binding protein [Acidobacteriota bacterium]